MRSITRPIASAGAAALLVLALAACGDDGGDKKGADDKASETESSQSVDESDATDPTDAASEGSSDAGVPSESATLDASTKDFCDGLKDIATTVGKVKGETPTEAEWKSIQGAYADLGDIGAPDDATDRQEEGFDIVIDAVTGLSYKEAKAEGGDAGGDTIPGVSAEENKLANEFFTYANTACAAYLQ